MLRYERVEEAIEYTRDIIRKGTEDSGKEVKVMQLREAINETKDHAK